MSIKTYSLKKDGNNKLSDNFKVKEFRCSDGSDEVLISDDLVVLLQKIRNHFNKPVIINSGYRTPEYNKKISGAKSSQHMNGTAADIKISGIDPLTVAFYAQSIGAGGIGLYSYENGGFVHVDVRKGKSRWVQVTSTGGYSVVQQIMPTIRKGTNGKPTTVLQRKLNQLGFNCGTADGKCGDKTINAVKEFQKKYSLTADGVAGAKTWAKISEVLSK